jgi:hypothetical protein
MTQTKYLVGDIVICGNNNNYRYRLIEWILSLKEWKIKCLENKNVIFYEDLEVNWNLVKRHNKTICKQC